MAPFNGNDPKYISCCCGAHVAKLAQVFIVLSIVSHFLNIFTLSPLALIGLLIACFGTFAVFQQVRSCIITYIVLEIFYIILYMICSMIAMVEDPTNRGNVEMIIFGGIFMIFVALALNFPFLITYWNLAEFIGDREAAERVPVHFEVHITKRATPAAGAAPSAPLVVAPAQGASSSDAPPPYEEKA